MKKTSTLALTAALAAVSLGAQAQDIAVDGKLLPTEMDNGTAAMGKYKLLGSYTNPRGFGTWGLLSFYAASTPTKIYMFVAGTVEQKAAAQGNSFQIYVNLPGITGISKGTALPKVGPAADGAVATTFENMGAKMDMEVDMALAVHGTTTAQTLAPSVAFYTPGATPTVSAKVLGPNLNTTTGAVVTLTGTDAAPYNLLAGARMAYQNSPDGTVTTNTGDLVGWEIELDRTALGLSASAQNIELFVAQNNTDGGYFSSDFIPQATTPLPAMPNSGNAATDPDFTAISGDQVVTYALTAATTATRAQVANTLNFSVYPNPAPASTMVSYNVPQGKQAVSLAVYDTMGRQVRAFSAAQSGAQSYSLSSLASGMYVVKLNVGGQLTSQKLVVK